MKKKNEFSFLNVRVVRDVAGFYSDIFGSLKQGGLWVIHEFPTIYRTTLLDMQGFFTFGELSMILDVMNGHGNVLSYGGVGLAGQHLPLSLHDSFKLYPGEYEKKWGVDKDEFMGKIDDLSRWQLICLEVFAAGFWSEKHKKTTADKYCKILLEDE